MEVEGSAEQMRYASAMRLDGTRVVAVFNYDADSPIEVRVNGDAHSIAPLDVKFIEVRK